MPRYQILQQDELNHLHLMLRRAYTNRSNHKRNALLEILSNTSSILQKEQPENFDKIIMGAAVFVLESIEAEYKVNPVQFTEGYFYNSGSKLYSALLKCLKIDENNSLNDDQRLVYLNQFYHFVNQHQSMNLNSNQYWDNTRALLKSITQYLRLIKNREYSHIELFTDSRPKLHVLKKNLNQLWIEYDRKTKSRWMGNKNRLNIIAFLEMISETCDESYPINEHNSTELNDLNYVKSFKIQMGAFVFALQKISDEYKWLKPENSLLYRQILQSINLKSLHHLDINQRSEWLRALTNHFSTIAAVPSYYNRIKYDSSLKGLKNLDCYQSDIDEQVFKLEKSKSDPSRVRRYVTRGTSYAAQFGIGIAATTFAAEAVLPMIPYAGGAIATAIGGPVGMVLYGATGTLLATTLGKLVEDKLMPKAIAGVYGKTLELAGEFVATTTVGLAAKAFSASTEGLHEFISHYRAKTNDDFLDDWIQTLITLPDSVMPQAEKEQIKMLIGEPVAYENYLSASMTSL